MYQQVKGLDEPGLSRLQALESKLGCCVIALERQSQPATLSEAQFEELQAMEKEMNTILVAFTC